MTINSVTPQKVLLLHLTFVYQRINQSPFYTSQQAARLSIEYKRDSQALGRFGSCNKITNHLHRIGKKVLIHFTVGFFHTNKSDIETKISTTNQGGLSQDGIGLYTSFRSRTLFLKMLYRICFSRQASEDLRNQKGKNGDYSRLFTSLIGIILYVYIVCMDISGPETNRDGQLGRLVDNRANSLPLFLVFFGTKQSLNSPPNLLNMQTYPRVAIALSLLGSEQSISLLRRLFKAWLNTNNRSNPFLPHFQPIHSIHPTNKEVQVFVRPLYELGSRKTESQPENLRRVVVYRPGYQYTITRRNVFLLTINTNRFKGSNCQV